MKREMRVTEAFKEGEGGGEDVIIAGVMHSLRHPQQRVYPEKRIRIGTSYTLGNIVSRSYIKAKLVMYNKKTAEYKNVEHLVPPTTLNYVINSLVNSLLVQAQ